MIRSGLILTGGKGTRLHSINNDTLPKALMQLDEHSTFLDYTIAVLNAQGITDICVSVRHQKEKIIEHIMKRYKDISVQEEPEDVGTGRALYLFAQRSFQPFIAMPVDYYYRNLNNSFLDISFESDSPIIWYASRVVNQYTQPHVIHNIYFDKETLHMKGYLSKATPEEKKYWEKEYKQNNSINRGSSMGVIAVNSPIYRKKVDEYGFSFPFCIYKDVAPLWIKEYGNPVENIVVKLTDVDVIDMGIPHQYHYIQQNYYETNDHSS